MMKCSKTVLALGIATLVSTGAMAAGNTIDDTHYFRLGVLSQKTDITVQSTIDPLPPIEIDMTDDLGMDDSSESVQILYRWRFADKWSLSAQYQKLELDGTGEATKDFNFDGNDYSAGVSVDTQFNVDTYLLDVGYSIIRNDKWELVVGGGVHSFDIDASIITTIGIEGVDDSIVGESVTGNAGVLAPLPNLRAAATYLITPRWEVNVSTGWLSLEIDDIEGKYTYLDIGTEYRFTDRFGVGAAYQLSKMDVTSTNTDGVDKFEMEFSGPSIYLSYGF